MSVLRNLANAFMPHPESRRAFGVLAASNAGLVLDVDGDNSATVLIDGGGATLNATYVIDGSPDGVQFFPLLAYPYTPGCVGGTIPAAGQPLLTEAVNAANIKRMLCLAVGGLRKLRVRLSAWTAGSANVFLTADTCDSISPYVRDQRAATLMVTATAAAGVAVTATLAAVAGLRHYIDRISVVRSMTAAQTASATPTVVTTTNIPGLPALTFGTDGAAVGQDKELVIDFGGAGCSAIAIGTATTVVCPVLAGAIWRVNVAYRLGL
jgi:hypothetical protein